MSVERARRLAPLRGLRPLSLHAGSDQERDADPARDRLPAGLRRSQLLPPRPRCGSRCVLEHGAGRSVSGSVRFLQASGERHQGSSGRSSCRAVAVGELAEEPVGGRSSSTASGGSSGRVRMRAEPLDDGVARVKLCVHNTTELERGRRRRPHAGAAREPALDPRRAAGRRRPVHLADRERRAARRRGGRLRERQHLAGARLARGRRRARRRDVPARPSPDRPREPRQPLRQHRDRGGAAAPRADPERGGARADRRPGPEGAAR